MKTNNYQAKKMAVRDEAIEWASDQRAQSWGEIFEMAHYFERMSKRYGLVGEFKENGII